MAMDTNPGESKSESTTLQQFLPKLLSWLPWLWLGFLALFTLGVTLQTGHLPSYSSPDPKDTGFLLFLYWPTLLLLPAALFSLVFWFLLGLSKHFFQLALPLPWRRTAVFLTGWILCAGVMVNDFAGLMTWLAD